MFGQTVIQVFLKYEALEFTGCYERESACFRFVRSAMVRLLDRQFVLQFMLMVVMTTGAKAMWSLPAKAIRNLQLQKLKQRYDQTVDKHKTD